VSTQAQSWPLWYKFSHKCNCLIHISEWSWAV